MGHNDCLMLQSSNSALCARLAQVRARAARAAPNKPPELVVAAKAQGEEALIPLLEAGHRCFGENRIEEAGKKWPELKASFTGIELHMIGALQSRKLKQALGLVDVLETLASERLARALAGCQAKGVKIPRLFIQINLAQEAHKPGLAPHAAGAFLGLLSNLGLKAEGLMIVPPQRGDPAPYFAAAAAMAKKFQLTYLSMGMSRDYELAAGLGATHIRPGEAIFGAREK